MNKLTAEDISAAYYELHLNFIGLNILGEHIDEYDLSKLEAVSQSQEPLTAQEIVDSYNVSPEVAEKLIGYQTALITDYRNTVGEYLKRVDRYMEVKPYLTDRRINKEIMSFYVENDWSDREVLREFNPMSHLRKGLVGVVLSVAIFLVATILGWNADPPKGFDFVYLGIVAVIWLGITYAAASQLPGNYRTRKIIYNIVSKK